jgi:hypothetical protein
MGQVMGLDKSITNVRTLAHDVVRGWEMAWEGQRIYDEAHSGSNLDGMDTGEQMEATGDEIATAAERRAKADGIDILNVLYVAEQLLDAKKRN